MIPKLSKSSHFTSNVWSLAVRFQFLTALTKDIFTFYTSNKVFSNSVKREKKQHSLLTWCNVTKSVRMVMVKVCHIVVMIDMNISLNRLVCMSTLLFVCSSVGRGHRGLNHSFQMCCFLLYTDSYEEHYIVPLYILCINFCTTDDSGIMIYVLKCTYKNWAFVSLYT